MLEGAALFYHKMSNLVLEISSYIQVFRKTNALLRQFVRVPLSLPQTRRKHDRYIFSDRTNVRLSLDIHVHTNHKHRLTLSLNRLV